MEYKNNIITVAELIAKLEQYPKSTRVVVAGYEGGYNDISLILERNLELDVNKQDYMGRHDDAEKGKESVKAIFLGGKNEIADEVA